MGMGMPSVRGNDKGAPYPGLQGWRTLTVATHSMTGPVGSSLTRVRLTPISRTLRRHGFQLPPRTLPNDPINVRLRAQLSRSYDNPAPEEQGRGSHGMPPGSDPARAHSSPASFSARSFCPAYQVAATVTAASRIVASGRPTSEVTMP